MPDFQWREPKLRQALWKLPEVWKKQNAMLLFPHLLGKGASLEIDRCLFHSYTQRRRRLKETGGKEKEIWRLTRKHHIEGAVLSIATRCVALDRAVFAIE
jgi:hypothetical protein